MFAARIRPASRRVQPDRRMRPILDPLEDRRLLSLTVQYDYSLDTRGFFAQSSRRTLFESTVNAIVSRLGDSLGAIASRSYTVEGVSGNVNVTTTVAANTLKLYVLGKPLAAPTVGNGGSQSLTVSDKYRGQSSTLDYAPAVSSIRFDDDGSTNWFFGSSTSTGVDFRGASTSLGSGNFDFVSSVRHEFLHCLGLTEGNTVFKTKVSGTNFVGGNAKAANRDSPVPLSGSHIATSITSVFNPGTSNGVRRDLTAIEWGMLDDMGWDIVSPPGFYRKYDLLTGGEDGEIVLNVIPSRGVYMMRIDAMNGDQIVVKTFDGTISSLKGVDSYLKIYDSQGRLLVDNDDTTGNKAELRYRPAQGGTFYVAAGTYSQRDHTFTTPSTTTPSSTGFRLSATIATRPDPTADNIASARTATALDLNIAASLNDSSDEDYYRIDATAGRTYKADTSFAGGLPGASIVTIYDAAGRKLAGRSDIDDDYGSASFTAPATGAYYVLVSRYAGSANVDPNQGTIGGGWAFVSSVDGHAGEGTATSANDYSLRITDTTPPPSQPPPGTTPPPPGGTTTPPPVGGITTPPAVTGVALVSRVRGRKVVSITLAYDRSIEPASAGREDQIRRVCKCSQGKPGATHQGARQENRDRQDRQPGHHHPGQAHQGATPGRRPVGSSQHRWPGLDREFRRDRVLTLPPTRGPLVGGRTGGAANVIVMLRVVTKAPPASTSLKLERKFQVSTRGQTRDMSGCSLTPAVAVFRQTASVLRLTGLHDTSW